MGGEAAQEMLITLSLCPSAAISIESEIAQNLLPLFGLGLLSNVQQMIGPLVDRWFERESYAL